MDGVPGWTEWSRFQVDVKGGVSAGQEREARMKT